LRRKKTRKVSSHFLRREMLFGSQTPMATGEINEKESSSRRDMHPRSMDPGPSIGTLKII